MRKSKLKKYLILIPLFFIVIFSIKMHGKVSYFRENKISLDTPPNILLYNCHYGSGHKMATQGIVESLPDCNIHVVDIYAEPLRFLDPMRDIFPLWSNEVIYNSMGKKVSF